jgi:hypothetical protein
MDLQSTVMDLFILGSLKSLKGLWDLVDPKSCKAVGESPAELLAAHQLLEFDEKATSYPSARWDVWAVWDVWDVWVMWDMWDMRDMASASLGGSMIKKAPLTKVESSILKKRMI